MASNIFHFLLKIFIIQSGLSLNLSEPTVWQEYFKNSPSLVNENIDPETIQKILNAGKYNPDKYLNTPQLVEKYGYEVETHNVLTKDMYNLRLFRLPNNRTFTPKCVDETDIVILAHGLFSSSDDFVTPGTKSGIAFLLAERGYEVWIINFRGNKYSRGHKTLSPDQDSSYWKFSFDQMGRYDLPASIDYILNVTGQCSVKFICHSQGCTNFLVMGSEHPEYSKKVSVVIGLSLLSWVAHTISPAMWLFAIGEPVIRGLELLGVHEFTDENPFNSFLREILCGTEFKATVICSNIVFLIGGFDYSQINITRFNVLISHVPAGVSLYNLEHWGQLVKSGKFQNFDYGIIKNYRVYETATPPDYDVSKIYTPIAVLLGEGDWLAREEDHKTLFKHLPNLAEYYKIPYKKFNHFDFIWSKDLSILILPKILKLLKRY